VVEFRSSKSRATSCRCREALWRGSAFADVDGYNAWERRVNERLAEALALSELG
jgi:hypothetical protein